MTRFRVTITEILSQTVEVDAANACEAIETVRHMYLNSKIILDASDYERTEISAKSEKTSGDTKRLEIIH